MIVDLFLQFIAFIVWVPIGILQVVEFAIPDSFFSAIEWGSQYMGYINGELPLFARPDMTGPVSYLGIIDIIGSLYEFFFWFVFAKVLFRIIGSRTKVEITKQ